VESKTTTIGKFSISLEGINPVCLLGLADENLRFITQNFDSRITVRGDRIRVSGPKTEFRAIRELFSILINAVNNEEDINPIRIKRELDSIRTGKKKFRAEIKSDTQEAQVGTIYTPKKVITPKSENQLTYLKAINGYDITIAIGPAGTGKTYLAVAKAVEALTTGKISRIILTRPAVEAGEQLGFLPGNFKEKVDPYMRPLYDAIYDMISIEKIRRLIDEQVIEVAPIAYMRGRTLSDAYIILDEAQNSTSTQMKMFLTRLGWNSKSIVTGDITQIDLDKKYSSGLVEIQHRLKEIDDIKFVYFDTQDVVRPSLVSKIIRAYERES
jgi:phosphate starvation-inducible PhoH-like protein